MTSNTDAGTPVVNEAQWLAKIREQLVHELRAEQLTPQQQEQLMKEVGEALLERATSALLKKVPSSVLLELGEMDGDPQKPEEAEKTLRILVENVPDAEQVITNEIKEGLQAYHAFLGAQSK